MKQNWKEIIKFSLPMTFIGIADILIILIDFIWVYIFTGKPETFGALRISSSIIILVEAVLTAIVGAIMVYVSQHFGAKDLTETRKGIINCFSFSIYGGLIVSVVGLTFMPLLELLFGVDEVTSTYVNNYLSYLFIGYVLISLNNMLLVLPRYFGEIKLIYKGLGIIIALNSSITPLLMVIFGKNDTNIISCAAIGTIIANLICFIYLFYKVFINDYLNIGLSVKNISFKVDTRLFYDNKAYISTEIFNGLSYNTSMFLYILILSYYPKEAFNVYAIGTYLYAIFGIFAQNFAASLIPMVSQRVGQGKYKEIKDLVKKMCTILFVYGIIIAIPVMLGSNLLADFISHDEQMTHLFSSFFMIYTIPWVLNLVAIVFVFVVAAAGDAKGGSILIVVNMYVIVITCLLIFPHLFSNLTLGVFFALGLIEILTFLFSWYYYLTGKWTKVSLIQKKEKLESI